MNKGTALRCLGCNAGYTARPGETIRCPRCHSKDREDFIDATEFARWFATRFIQNGEWVTLTPDSAGGRFSVSMDPDQAAWAAERLAEMAETARTMRAARCPALFSIDDADGGDDER